MLNFFNIFALLFALPLQMLALVQTIEHMSEHKDSSREIAHEHSDDEDHHHSDEDPAPVDSDEAEHQHGKGEPFHSHAKELSGVLVQMGVPSSDSSEFYASNFEENLHQFNSQNLNGQSIPLPILRPPIT